MEAHIHACKIGNHKRLPIPKAALRKLLFRVWTCTFIAALKEEQGGVRAGNMQQLLYFYRITQT